MPAEEKRLVFGRASPAEVEAARRVLAENFGARASGILEEGIVYASRAYWTELHLLPAELEDLVAILGLVDRHPYSAGLFLGWLRRGVFRPSLPLLHRMVGLAERGLVLVSDKAAQLFVYGRDVLCSSVKGFPKARPREGQLVIVVNELGEALGAGIYRGGDDVCVENLIDLGWYLRRAG